MKNIRACQLSFWEIIKWMSKSEAYDLQLPIGKTNAWLNQTHNGCGRRLDISCFEFPSKPHFTLNHEAILFPIDKGTLGGRPSVQPHSECISTQWLGESSDTLHPFIFFHTSYHKTVLSSLEGAGNPCWTAVLHISLYSFYALGRNFSLLRWIAI
jgi:hypothetical protein